MLINSLQWSCDLDKAYDFVLPIGLIGKIDLWMENMRNMKESCGWQWNLAGSKLWYVLANAMGVGRPILESGTHSPYLECKALFLGPLLF